MNEPDNPVLVTTAWLAGRLAAPDLRVLDASWYMPDDGRDAKAEYRAGHIPGALFFDIDAVSDRDSPLPHMLPSPEEFAACAGALGIGDGDRVVVYDGGGVHAAARAWWMFRVFGHDRVAVLDGGLGRWRADGLALGTDIPTPRPRRFTARRRPALVADRHRVGTLAGEGVQILDARSPARFAGSEPDPRPGVAPGHIPGSRNLHYARLYEADGRLKPPEVLEELFATAGADIDRPVIASCGSGVTACSLALALERLGRHDWRVYDGSWAEWGSDPGLARALGPA